MLLKEHTTQNNSFFLFESMSNSKNNGIGFTTHII
jgi:hypothetical protein